MCVGCTVTVVCDVVAQCERLMTLTAVSPGVHMYKGREERSRSERGERKRRRKGKADSSSQWAADGGSWDRARYNSVRVRGVHDAPLRVWHCLLARRCSSSACPVSGSGATALRRDRIGGRHAACVATDGGTRHREDRGRTGRGGEIVQAICHCYIRPLSGGSPIRYRSPGPDLVL